MRERSRDREQKPKTLTRQAISGQRGVNTVESIFLSFGSRWNPTSALDVGIDGEVELCDPETGEALGLIIRVQSKAISGNFLSETDTRFDYVCDERDLDYWFKGNVPVILVVSRPDTREAYWIPVREYFTDPAKRAQKRVRFSKATDKLDANAWPRLQAMAARRDAGVYLAPKRRHEILISNLLEVEAAAEHIYVADTGCRRPLEVFSKLPDGFHGGEWLLKEGRIYSFHDLTEEVWASICDRGTVEEFDTSEWSEASDPVREREFVWLLNRALRQRLFPTVLYLKQLDCYYWGPPKDLKPVSVIYRASKRDAKRNVFKGRPRKSGEGMTYYRHAAFEAGFRRFNDNWYLEINPTYVFTRDGEHISRYHADNLSGIKRFERNPGVLAWVMMWADHLARRDLFTQPYPFLAFGKLVQAEIDSGIDDDQWVSAEPVEDRGTLGDEEDLPLFSG